MASFLVFGRTAYADPLALIDTVEAAATPGLDDLDTGTDWLELVVVPTDAAIWVQRDGDVVDTWAGAAVGHMPASSSAGVGNST